MSKKPSTKANPAKEYTPRKMQLATILSDLNSLRASDAQAARALVSARVPPAGTPVSSTNGVKSEEQPNAQDAAAGDLLDDYAGDAELERAFKLSRLHRTVKLAYMEPGSMDDGSDIVEETGGALAALRESRESVRLATRSLGFDTAPTTEDRGIENAQIFGKDSEEDTTIEVDEDEELAAWS